MDWMYSINSSDRSIATDTREVMPEEKPSIKGYERGGNIAVDDLSSTAACTKSAALAGFCCADIHQCVQSLRCCSIVANDNVTYHIHFKAFQHLGQPRGAQNLRG